MLVIQAKMMFQLDELHPIYQSVDHDEAVIIANIGASAYCSSRDKLHEHWTIAMSEEDTIKMEKWKAEGRRIAFEEYRERLQDTASLEKRLVTAQGELSAIQSSVETIIEQRVAGVLENARKDFEYAKLQETSELRQQLAVSAVQKQLLDALQEKLQHLEKQRDALQEKIHEQTVAATKSSHALGKKGEASVFEMMEEYVVPNLPNAEMHNVATKSHVGDIHLWAHNASGKRVKVMIDVKNYSSPVQRTEVEKLYSNVDADDAVAGIMLSMSSTIYTKKQFQIVRSASGKPCMFVSFEGIDDDMRHEVLCWALRTLLCITDVSRTSDQDVMIADAITFMNNMISSLKEFDVALRASKGSYDILKKARDAMAESIASYNIISYTGNVIEHVGEVDMQCTGTVRSGGRCKARRLPISMFCKRHTDEAAKKGE